MRKQEPGKFRLRRYFSIASGLLMLAVVLPLAYAYYYSEIREHTIMAGMRNEMLARTYANALWPSFGAFLLREDIADAARKGDVNTKLLDERIRQMSREVPVVKIKVFNRSGKAVYSSVMSEIGEDKSGNSGFIQASKGKLVNELTYRGKMSATEGEIENVDVVSTYIPIHVGGTGEVQAVFELYSDVTQAVARIEIVTMQLLAGLVAVFLLLYLSLLAIVARADRIIQRQYLALEESETHLQAKARELEREIQERIEAEQALRRSEEVAASASKAKSEFLSSMSHELRTPMNAILGFTQLLETEPDAPLTETQKKFVHQILKAGSHLLGLIDQVLDLARIEAGKLSLSVEPVGVKALVEEALGMVQHMLSQRNITPVTVEVGDLRVAADYGRLRQVVLNLLSNAVKYNRPGGQIWVSASEAGGKVKIAVKDTGPGIPCERLDELFKPFSRLAMQSGDIEGTGIGLALSKRIVEAMGGEIGVDTTEGEGSTFWLTLPVTRPAQTAALDAKSETLGAVANAQDGIKTILYIEDNPANLMLMQELVKRIEGVRLISAHTSELGLALAQQEQPQLIIMDINLPGMDGYQALAALRRDPLTSQILTMALSANAMKTDIARGLAAGFLRYHTKPVRVDEMTQSILDALA